MLHRPASSRPDTGPNPHILQASPLLLSSEAGGTDSCSPGPGVSYMLLCKSLRLDAFRRGLCNELCIPRTPAIEPVDQLGVLGNMKEKKGIYQVRTPWYPERGGLPRPLQPPSSLPLPQSPLPLGHHCLLCWPWLLCACSVPRAGRGHIRALREKHQLTTGRSRCC